jgi:hypothetical protein
MKLRIEECRQPACFACLVLGLAVAANADVIRQTVSYPTNVVAGFHSIDFDRGHPFSSSTPCATGILTLFAGHLAGTLLPSGT